MASHPLEEPIAKRGEVWTLPPESPQDKPGRRHAILSPVTPRYCGTAAYGSTSTLARDKFRAPACTVPARPSGNGLVEPTHFYVPKLKPAFDYDLERRAGVLSGLEYLLLRKKMRGGLDIGRGRCGDPGAHAGSWRGRIVEVKESATAGGWAQFGVVVTGHEHSAYLYYQAIVPILQSDPGQNHPLDIVVSRGPLVRLLGEGVDAVVFSPVLTFSVFHRREVERDTGAVVTGYWMDRIDDALAKHLNCAEPIR